MVRVRCAFPLSSTHRLPLLTPLLACEPPHAASTPLHSYRAAWYAKVVAFSCLLRRIGNLIPLAVVLFMQVVNLKNGSVMKYLDPTTKQITGMVYCPQERAVLTASSNGQVGAHSVVAVGCLCAICCRFLVLLLLPIAGSGERRVCR